MNDTYLYHIHLPCDLGNYEVGYIGVTTNMKRRFSVHKSNQRYTDTEFGIAIRSGAVMTEIARGSREEMESLEAQYRPRAGMGWNIAPGGGIRALPKLGKPLSKEHREAISAANIGRIVSEQTREKMSKAHKGRLLSETHKEKLTKARQTHIYIINGNTYNSSREAAESLGCSYNAITHRCKSTNPRWSKWLVFKK